MICPKQDLLPQASNGSSGKVSQIAQWTPPEALILDDFCVNSNGENIYVRIEVVIDWFTTDPVFNPRRSHATITGSKRTGHQQN